MGSHFPDISGKKKPRKQKQNKQNKTKQNKTKQNKTKQKQEQKQKQKQKQNKKTKQNSIPWGRGIDRSRYLSLLLIFINFVLCI